MPETHELLAKYARDGSEEAFREVVNRYVDLVYSAAVRLVNGDQHLAEDITQTVFTDLARMAKHLSKELMLGGWLHRHTCFVASKTMRAERRRQNRERQAMEMNSMEDHAEANFEMLSPVLDEAINELRHDDRKAILLRYFEQKDFRSVGESLGSNEEAARKRVNRALEKLERLLKRRGVTFSAAALAAVLGGKTVTAAPIGMAATVLTTALSGATAGGLTTLTLLKIMGMTKLKAGVIGAIALAVAIPLIVQKRAQARLREENESLRAQVKEVRMLEDENDRLSNQIARAKSPNAARTNEQLQELMRLRGEVGVLRQQKPTEPAIPKTNAPSVLSGLSANPEVSKMIRMQQKAGMTAIYQGLAKRLKLSEEKTEKLNDLLADNVMENINRITEVLREKKGPEERDRVFAEQDAALQDKIKELLGPDSLAEYQDYTHNLASYLTAEQFKSMLKGDQAAKENQGKQLYALMQEETKSALANAGLDENYQAVPMLNFRNIASEEDGESSVKLLEGIYQRVQGRAGSFLKPEELEKFKEFCNMALANNRAALTLNRKMMAPAAQ